MTNPIDTTDLASGLAQVRALREACHVGHAAAKDLAVDLALDGWKASSVAFLAAAPDMADMIDAYAARLAEVEGERDRLAAELDRARKALAAEERDSAMWEERLIGAADGVRAVAHVWNLHPDIERDLLAALARQEDSDAD